MDTFLIAAWSGWALLAKLAAFGKAGLGLGFVIFVHELGHFLAAKACGVKCEKFYVGFDVPIKIGPITLPRAFFRKKWGETEYGIGVIPLGGYVKMLGQDDNPANAAQEAERIRMARKEAEQTGKAPSYDLDPRSYPAKSVPKRMLIISAGVIMNIIFAAIFATAAYYWGVEYTPCVVGKLEPGEPAWESNSLQVGDKILQLGRTGQPSEYLRFDHDLAQYVAMSNGQPLELLVRQGNSEPRWVSLTARKVGQGVMSHFQLGIQPAESAKIAKEKATLVGSPAYAHEKELAGGKVVKVEIGGVGHTINTYNDLSRLTSQYAPENVTYWVEHAAKSTDSKENVSISRVTLAPNRRHLTGVDFEPGPIVSVRQGSPAELAGLRAGDRLQSVNGTPVVGVFQLQYLFDRLIGQDVQLEVTSGDDEQAEQRSVTLRPVAPEASNRSDMSDDRVAVQALGAVFKTEPSMTGLSAATLAAGVQEKDILVSFAFRLPENAGEGTAKTLRDYRLDDQSQTLEADRIGVELFEESAQLAPVGALIDIVYLRGNDTNTATLTLSESTDDYTAFRGISMESEFAIRKATSFTEAASLGTRETWESLTKVFVFLRKLATGQVPLTNVGGPLTIGLVATSHASSGVPRLLIILTLISANLAVLNFLPIPVLDGGHMMFLFYEGIFGKPMNDRMAFLLTMVGFSFILMLMALAFGMDIYRFVEIFR